ncbi:hypothetical protein E2562_000738 [Oryza meyeriana var. granulata]|uniref:Uncharacterized protein n=1 Tax=Oryza meyeriana var. granulata TaxID=110450 RepID=A0A6G1DU33_9ORYZ|nr:hypothetical protein E2562_000738 [Oryza meyeriana var. granulata]
MFRRGAEIAACFGDRRTGAVFSLANLLLRTLGVADAVTDGSSSASFPASAVENTGREEKGKMQGDLGFYPSSYAVHGGRARLVQGA